MSLSAKTGVMGRWTVGCSYLRCNPCPVPGRANRLCQCADVIGAVVAPAVDEERGRSRNAALIRARDVLAEPRLIDASPEIFADAIAVEAELIGIVAQMARLELSLVAEQDVVH